MGSHTTETGEGGVFSVQVQGSEDSRISSGLAAVAITPIPGSGIELSAISPINVQAYRLLEPSTEQPCRVVVGNEESIVWPYYNYTDDVLTLPESLNFFTGKETTPETIFAPGFTNYFLRSLQVFEKGGGYSGEWNVLGLKVPIPNPLGVCTNRGDQEERCPQVPGGSISAIFDVGTAIVTDSYSMSLRIKARLRRSGWKPTGRRDVYLAQGERVLARIRKILRDVQPSGVPIYECAESQAVPTACAEYDFPKEKIRSAMRDFFDIRPEPGFERITSDRREREQLAELEKALSRLPNRFVRCN